jgi:hypothetical protein
MNFSLKTYLCSLLFRAVCLYIVFLQCIWELDSDE